MSPRSLSKTSRHQNGHKAIINTGKHKGKEFSKVYEMDFAYSAWMAAHPNHRVIENHGNLKAFSEFCKQMKTAEKQKEAMSSHAKDAEEHVIMSSNTSYKGATLLHMSTAIINSGKHEGKEFLTVYRTDSNYSKWMAKHSCLIHSDNLMAFGEFCMHMLEVPSAHEEKAPQPEVQQHTDFKIAMKKYLACREACELAEAAYSLAFTAAQSKRAQCWEAMTAVSELVNGNLDLAPAAFCVLMDT
jgi:hypothetical protein